MDAEPVALRHDKAEQSSEGIPTDWRVEPFHKVVEPTLFIDGDWVESKDQSPEGDVRLIQLADIGDGYFINKSDRHLTKSKAHALRCTFLREGDLLIARMPDPLGRCCRFPLEGKERYVTVVDVAVVRPCPSFDAAWLMNLINADFVRQRIIENAGGSTRQRISRKNLGQIPVPVPPLPEQQRIAEILTAVDDSIRAGERVIEQTERVKKGLMEELLTGGLGSAAIERGEVPEGWERRTLQSLCSEKPEYGANAPKEQYDPTLPRYVRITDITGDGHLSEDTKVSLSRAKAEGYILNEGDLLFARSGATVGKSYVHRNENGECAFAGYLIRFKLRREEALHEWAKYVFQSKRYLDWVRDSQRAGAQPNINAKEYGSYEVLKPPMPEQQRIASILTSIDEQIAAERKHVEQQKRLKRGLMDDLLTGRVRTV